MVREVAVRVLQGIVVKGGELPWCVAVHQRKAFNRMEALCYFVEKCKAKKRMKKVLKCRL